jgi:hypothetical protein
LRQYFEWNCQFNLHLIVRTGTAIFLFLAAPVTSAFTNREARLKKISVDAKLIADGLSDNESGFKIGIHFFNCSQPGPHAAGIFIGPIKYKTTFIAIYQKRLLHVYGK